MNGVPHRRRSALPTVLTLAMTWPLLPGSRATCLAISATRCSTCGFSGGAPSTCPRSLAGQHVARTTTGTPTSFTPSRSRSSFSEHLFGQVAADSPGLPPDRESDPRATTCCFSRRSSLSGLGMYLLVRELLGDEAGVQLRRIRRRADLRVRAVPHRTGRAHPVGQLAVDAARAVRFSPVHRHTDRRSLAAALRPAGWSAPPRC